MEITKEMIKRIVLREGMGWLDKIFKDYEDNIDVREMIIRLYPKNYRAEDDAFVVNVKGRGLPDWDIIKKRLSEKIGVSEKEIQDWINRHSDLAEDVVWETIGDIVESLREDLSVEDVYQYGRMGGYWGIPVENIEIEIKIPEWKKRELINGFLVSKWFDELYDYLIDVNERVDFTDEVLIESHIRDALEIYIDDLVRDGQLNFVEFVKFKDNLPERFIELVEETVEYWDSQEPWVDVGLASFATFSNGSKIENPRFFRKDEKDLAKVQRKLSKAEKGSPERKKRRKAVAKVHERISNRRNNFCHQEARKIVNQYGIICIEDLSVNQMAHNRCLSKSIHDAAWFKFAQYLVYKAESADRQLIKINPAYTSQTCSKCGHREVKKLSDRVHHCSCCGFVCDRDHNASLNILRLGTQSLGIQSVEAPTNL